MSKHEPAAPQLSGHMALPPPMPEQTKPSPEEIEQAPQSQTAPGRNIAQIPILVQGASGQGNLFFAVIHLMSLLTFLRKF